MSDIGNALAGAAAGLGGYLVQQAQTEYAAALRQAELDAREQVDVRSDTRQHGFRMTEEEARAKAQQENTRLSSNLAGGREAASDNRSRGLLESTYQGDDGKMYGVTRGGETVELKSPPPAPKSTRLTANEATDQARKDFQMWQAQDEANTGAAKGTGKVLNSDGSVADPQRWINNRARQYMAGQNSTTKSQAAPAPAKPPASASYDSTGSIAAARAAIKQGKDRNAVIQRLRDNGITPPPDL